MSHVVIDHLMKILLYLATPLGIGIIHTLVGPDHYVPFIALSKARNWTLRKTVIVTTVCGIGHVLSAIILGIFAVTIGSSIIKLRFIESFRGEIAIWLLIGFGFVYCIWGLRQAFKSRYRHHLPLDNSNSTNPHAKKGIKELVPWLLFIIFVLGPCEPLIPLVMYPAIQGDIPGVFIISALFGVATIITMLGMVVVSVYGIQFIKFKFLEKYGHAAAGALICSLGVAVKVFGL